MYSNANATINNKRERGTDNARHLMALSMIKQNTKRHEGTMVSKVDPLKEFNDIVIPIDDETDDSVDDSESTSVLPAGVSPSPSSSSSPSLFSPLAASSSASASASAAPSIAASPIVLTRGRTKLRRDGVVSMTISRDINDVDQQEPVLDRRRVAMWIQKVSE